MKHLGVLTLVGWMFWSNLGFAQTSRPNQGARILFFGEPSDYFPVNIGKRFCYDISLPQRIRDPLRFRLIFWPIGDGENAMVSASRGVLRSFEGVRNAKLVFEIEGNAPEQGPLRYSRGVKLRIVRDDLLVFGLPEYNDGVYWAIDMENNRFYVVNVVLYSDMSPGAPTGSYGLPMSSGAGYSLQYAFFIDNPGTGVKLGSENPDELIYVGPQEYNGSSALYFRRVVLAGTSSDSSTGTSYLQNGYMEDMWFVRNVGLVRLVQTVQNAVTMVWKLNLQDSR